jgi:TPR repeat protein
MLRPLEPTKSPDHQWPPARRRFRFGLLSSLAIACAVSAAVASTWVGFMLIDQMQMPPPSLHSAVAEINRIASQSAAVRPPERVVHQTPPQLIVTQAGPSGSDEARRLDVALDRISEGAILLVNGLAQGSAVSAGRPAGGNWWRLSAAELGNAAVTPPHGFVGNMDLTLELRLSDNSLADRKTVRLEWAPPKHVPPSQPERRLDPVEIAALVDRGQQFVAKGDLAAARSLFERAAEARDATAAFALAETYDPNALQRWGEKGFAPDIAMARTWYERAKEFGSQEAAQRLQTIDSRDH